MTFEPTAKWRGFFLSLAFPGLGQAYQRDHSAFVWLAAAVALIVIQAIDAWPLHLASAAGWIVLSITAAEHAKRLAETRRDRRAMRAVASLMRRLPCRRRIAVEMRFDLDLSVEHLWRQVADLRRFLVIDPFHDEILIPDGPPRAGQPIVLDHCAFGCRFLRVGRLLTWREGRGYAFSDLSPHDPRRGFPHVFFVRVEPLRGDARHRSRLVIVVRGKWTSRVVPVWLGSWWVYYVCREHARLLSNNL